MKFLSKTMFVVITTIIFTSCAVSKASLESDTKAKQTTVSSGEALVYIVRPQVTGFAIRFNVDCDGNHIGTTTAKRFIYTVQKSGMHKISSHAENTDELNINLESGKIYYIEQIPTMGFAMARNVLKIIDATEGKEKLSKCSLSSDCVTK